MAIFQYLTVCKVSWNTTWYIQNLEKLSNHSTSGASDVVWLLLRMLPRGIIPGFPQSSDGQSTCIVPFWKGYHSQTSSTGPNEQVTKTCKVHLPIVDAPPTNKQTVYTAMKNCRNLTSLLGQTTSVQTMDQQLYVIAQEIKWDQPITFKDHYLRLGTFHARMSFLAAVGKIWGDAGLREVLVDSGCFAAGTADLVIQGKEYNRAVRAYTLVYEAFAQLRFQMMLQWLNNQNRSLDQSLLNHLQTCRDLIISGASPKSAIAELNRLVETHILPIMAEFRDDISSVSPNFQFWDSFLRAVEVLLLSIKADRNGDWESHLCSMARMLPYYAITDKVNYMRWTPVYILDMLSLPSDALNAFRDGQFVVRETNGSFNGIPSDLSADHSIKVMKGPGGVKNVTRKLSSLIRWGLTRHLTGEWSAKLKSSRAKQDDHDNVKEHRETKSAEILRDDNDVHAIVRHITGNMHNPFSWNNEAPDDLIHLATGMHAPISVQRSLLNCVQDGQTKIQDFVDNVLSTTGSGSFSNAIKQSKVKTFKDLKKPVHLKTKTGLKTARINPEMVFRRVVCIIKFRPDLDLLSVLSLPMGGEPPCLFHEDGMMRKTCKSELLHFLVQDIEPLDFPSVCDVYVIDMMSLLHRTRGQHICQTFDQMALHLLRHLIDTLHYAHFVICSFDVYSHPHDVKHDERRRRRTTSPRIYEVIGSANLPKWNKFLEVDENKTAFSLFLSKFIESNAPDLMDDTKVIYLSGCYEDIRVTKSVTRVQTAEVPEMATDHIESDSRMLFLMSCLNEDFNRSQRSASVVISSGDTDVLLLACYHAASLGNITNLYWETNTIAKNSNMRQVFLIQTILDHVDPMLMSILPHIHALTGCDTTSAFFFLGKKTVLKTLNKIGAKNLQNLKSLGCNNTQEAVDASRQLVAALYDSKYTSLHSDLNRLRTKLANVKESQLSRLPPPESAFKQHVLRAMWQAKVWVNALFTNPTNDCSPFDYGWQETAAGIQPIMYQGPTVTEMLDGLVCNCKGKKRCLTDCSCSNAGFPCIELCSCLGCTEAGRNAFAFISSMD